MAQGCFRDGGHANRIRSQAPKRSDFRRGFECRPGKGDVYALVNTGIILLSRLDKQVAQGRVVDLGLIGESWHFLICDGTDQRVASHKIQVVGKNHHVPNLKGRPNASGCIGQEQVFDSQLVSQQDRKADWTPPITLVQVSATLENQGLSVANPAKVQLAVVTGNGGGAQSWDLVIRQTLGVRQVIDQRPPPRPADHAGVGNDFPPAIPQVCRGFP